MPNGSFALHAYQRNWNARLISVSILTASFLASTKNLRCPPIVVGDDTYPPQSYIPAAYTMEGMTMLGSDQLDLQGIEHELNGIHDCGCVRASEQQANDLLIHIEHR